MGHTNHYNIGNKDSSSAGIFGARVLGFCNLNIQSPKVPEKFHDGAQYQEAPLSRDPGGSELFGGAHDDQENKSFPNRQKPGSYNFGNPLYSCMAPKIGEFGHIP